MPKGNYVLIGGDAGQTGSTLMQEGYHTVLDPLVAKGDIKIVMDQFTPAWKTEPAQANAENALTANNNKVDAFLVSYDGMSLGVLQAIEAAGHQARLDSCHRPGHGVVGGSGDRRGTPVRQPVAGARRDGDRRARRPPSRWRNAKTSGPRRPPTTARARSPGSRRRSISSARTRWPTSSASTPIWLEINEVYKNVPDKKPTCK